MASTPTRTRKQTKKAAEKATPSSTRVSKTKPTSKRATRPSTRSSNVATRLSHRREESPRDASSPERSLASEGSPSQESDREDVIRRLLREVLIKKGSRRASDSPRHSSRQSSRQRRRYSVESSEPREVERPRVSFIQSEGTQPMTTLQDTYRAVDGKWFHQIYVGSFRPENLTRLAQSVIHRSTNKEA